MGYVCMYVCICMYVCTGGHFPKPPPPILVRATSVSSSVSSLCDQRWSALCAQRWSALCALFWRSFSVFGSGVELEERAWGAASLALLIGWLDGARSCQRHIRRRARIRTRTNTTSQFRRMQLSPPTSICSESERWLARANAHTHGSMRSLVFKFSGPRSQNRGGNCRQ